MKGKKKLPELPRSNDSAKYNTEPVKIPICRSHSKDEWMKHTRYIDNGDGTASCEDCSWGFKIPGYLRIYKGKVVDLRDRR